MLTLLALLDNIYHDLSRTESSTMKASSVTVGAVATLFAATMGTLPDSTDSTRETETDEESLFTDKAPDDGGSLYGRSVIDHRSAYGTADQSVLDGLKPSSATVLSTGRKRTSDNEPTTIVVRPTTESIHPTERDRST